MFGNDKSYFAGSPVVIDISGLEWPSSSPFDVVRAEVLYEGVNIGDVHADTGGQSEISFDIKSALKAIWAGYDFGNELSAAKAALTANAGQSYIRAMREYSIRLYTEYMASDDGGVFTQTGYGPFSGGRCMIGRLTEWERSLIEHKEDADASHWEHTNLRNGDASTKPNSSPERVGKHSITSWVDVSNSGTTSVFYPSSISPAADGQTAHAPIVLRDDIDYVDFLFVNRRGAVETCSALMKENMSIDVETKVYSRIERPTFKPVRSLMAVSDDGRRSWEMSSGGQPREWAEWWTMEFLTAKQHWMLYKGVGSNVATFVPVIVEPAKKSTGIYDLTKQQMPSVEFTVTLALKG